MGVRRRAAERAATRRRSSRVEPLLAGMSRAAPLRPSGMPLRFALILLITACGPRTAVALEVGERYRLLELEDSSERALRLTSASIRFVRHPARPALLP